MLDESRRKILLNRKIVKNNNSTIYKPLKCELMEIGGLLPSMQAMRLPFDAGVSDSYKDEFSIVLGAKDSKRATNLIKGGDSHAKAMRGIDVWIKMNFQIGFMLEFVTYKIGCDDLSTSSSMHNELKKFTGINLIEEKQKGLVDKVYTRIIKINYQSIRHTYIQRRSHQHLDWQIWCDFVETLPYFNILIYPEFKY